MSTESIIIAVLAFIVLVLLYTIAHKKRGVNELVLIRSPQDEEEECQLCAVYESAIPDLLEDYDDLVVTVVYVVDEGSAQVRLNGKQMDGPATIENLMEFVSKNYKAVSNFGKSESKAKYTLWCRERKSSALIDFAAIKAANKDKDYTSKIVRCHLPDDGIISTGYKAKYYEK